MDDLQPAFEVSDRKAVFTVGDDETAPFMTIYGHDYRMTSMDELDFVQMAKIRAMGREIERAGEGMTDLTVEQAEDVHARLGDAIKLILPELPDDVLAKISDGRRIELIGAFSAAVGLSVRNMAKLTPLRGNQANARRPKRPSSSSPSSKRGSTTAA